MAHNALRVQAAAKYIVRRDLGHGLISLSMARPKVNALNAELLDELAASFTSVSRDEGVRGVLFRSDMPGCFSAGMDLENVGRIVTSGSRSEAQDLFFNMLDAACRAIVECRVPVASVVSGHAIAGGMILGCIGDFVAVDRSNPRMRIGLTELAVGVPFPTFPLRLLEKQLGSRAARDFVYQADLCDSTTAHSRGFGDLLTDKPEDDAIAWLQRVASPDRPLPAFTQTKSVYWQSVIDSKHAERRADEKSWLAALFSDECAGVVTRSLAQARQRSSKL